MIIEIDITDINQSFWRFSVIKFSDYESVGTQPFESDALAPDGTLRRQNPSHRLRVRFSLRLVPPGGLFLASTRVVRTSAVCPVLGVSDN